MSHAPEGAAPDDGRGRRSPRRWARRLGALTLTYLPDATVELAPAGFLPDATEDDWAGRTELRTEDGYLVAGAGSLVAERDGHRLVLDAGFGPVSRTRGETPPPLGAVTAGELPASFAAAGIAPDSVDLVAFTHLHSDHVGWATAWAVDDGRSLFPHAAWAVGAGELEGDHVTAELQPAGHAERARVVADGEEVRPGMRAWSLPGHTSGHTAYVLDTGDGRRVIAFGDALHSPAQVEQPGWTVALDADHEGAERSRRTLLAALDEPDVLGLGIHFADRQLGRVVDGRWRSPV